MNYSVLMTSESIYLHIFFDWGESKRALSLDCSTHPPSKMVQLSSKMVQLSFKMVQLPSKMVQLWMDDSLKAANLWVFCLLAPKELLLSLKLICHTKASEKASPPYREGFLEGLANVVVFQQKLQNWSKWLLFNKHIGWIGKSGWFSKKWEVGESGWVSTNKKW